MISAADVLPPTVTPHDSSEETTEDDYLAYLKGDNKFLEKYESEHAKFKAAEKAMLKEQHEKVTKVCSIQMKKRIFRKNFENKNTTIY